MEYNSIDTVAAMVNAVRIIIDNMIVFVDYFRYVGWYAHVG